MFAKRLKLLRREKGITQKELSNVLNLSQQAVGMWEIGKREPDFETLNALANFFNVSTDYLLGKTNITTPSGKKNDDSTPETKQPYIFIAGKSGEMRKFPVPAEKMERFKKLMEAGLPEIFDYEDDL